MDDAAPLADSTQPPQPDPELELAPAAPIAAGGMLGMVMPAASPTSNRSSMSGRVRRVLGEIASWGAVVLVLAVLFAPPVALLIAGCWSVVAYVTSAVTLYKLIAASRLADLLGPLQTLDMAGRIAATSAGFYALLCGLLVLAAGLLGKRWRRLFLVPGTVLSIPAALAFYLALRLTLDAIAPRYSLSGIAQAALTIYLLLDAVLLAGLLVDLRPRPRHARNRPRPRWRRDQRGQRDADPEPEFELEQPASPSLPLVHFGPPSVPLSPALPTPAPLAPHIRIVPVLTPPDTSLDQIGTDCPPPSLPIEQRSERQPEANGSMLGR